jgi:hypothetical protein
MPTAEEAFDPRNPPSGWQMVEDNEFFTRYEADLGDGRVIQRTEQKHTPDMMRDIHEAHMTWQNKKWGDGAVVGRVPLNLYYSSGLAEANRQRDKKFIAKFWNDPNHSRLRIKGGTV